MDNINASIICVIVAKENEVIDNGRNCFQEIMTNHFPNSMKAINSLIQEAQQTPSSISTKQNTARYIIIKLLNVSDKE